MRWVGSVAEKSRRLFFLNWSNISRSPIIEDDAIWDRLGKNQ